MEVLLLASFSAVHRVIYTEGLEAVVKFYSLAFNWFLSIKLNTHNRLISVLNS